MLAVEAAWSCMETSALCLGCIVLKQKATLANAFCALYFLDFPKKQMMRGYVVLIFFPRHMLGVAMREVLYLPVNFPSAMPNWNCYGKKECKI